MDNCARFSEINEIVQKSVAIFAIPFLHDGCARIIYTDAATPPKARVARKRGGDFIRRNAEGRGEVRAGLRRLVRVKVTKRKSDGGGQVETRTDVSKAEGLHGEGVKLKPKAKTRGS